MNRDRGAPPQRPLRSPLAPSNLGGGGAAPADAVGSSTKDHAWQQRTWLPAASKGGAAARDPPLSDRKKSKKVEGTVLEGGSHAGISTAKQPASASRIPAGPRFAAAVPPPTQQQQQQQQPTPATAGGSRIPRPPVFAGAASPQPDWAAMLATPAAPPLLPELHAGGTLIGRTPAFGASSADNGAFSAPQGFQAFSNPSFDGAALAGTPAAAGAAAGSAANVFVNSLAEAGESEDAEAQLTPGLLDPAALTPNSERSLEAWLRSSPASAPAASGPRTLRGRPPLPPSASAGGSGGRSSSAASEAHTRAPASAVSAASAGSTGASRGRALPTPEAWHLLQHINDDSPAAAPKGVRGIMNAYLRTGPQALSPEPSGAGETGLIRAPGATAVPASGLLNVAGPGGAGVMGMMHAYLRTGAHVLSPEPGMEGGMAGGAASAGRQAPPPPLLHPYSPVSPLAATPGPAAAHAGPAATVAPSSGGLGCRPISPASVCSNGEVGSSSPAAPSVSLGGGSAPPSVPRLNLSGLLQQKDSDGNGARGGTNGTEVSFGAALPASPDDGELPTARLSPVAVERHQGATMAETGVAAERQQPVGFGLASPFVSCLAASGSPSFSFGFGHVPAAVGATVTAGQQGDPDAAAAGAAVAAEAADPDDAAPSPALRRIDSGETVQQHTLYNTMLDHLRGPQYASPARFAMPQRADSPQSPQQCTPLHLISTSDTSPPRVSGALVATPAPGQGSLTVWMDRRGMRATLSTPARNDLRLLWAAARDIRAYQSEAAALRADNAALLGELEAAQEALQELGAEHEAAVVAAEAGALCAEAEVARARDAAGHMMALADQIQGMFALCENEKESLVQELDAAQAQLAQSEAAAADTAHLSERQRGQLEAQLEEARQAVAAAQSAADAAQQRATDASKELTAIRRQLSEAQAQLAGVQAAQRAAQERAQQAEAQARQAEAAPALTPVAKLRGQLSAVHDSLAQLHAEHHAGRLHAATPELDKLWEASREQLARIEALLGADPAALRAEQGQLQACLERARTLLAKHTPATGIPGSTAAGPAGSASGSHRSGSPVPFALFGRLSSEGERGVDGSPASSAAAASPDVFSSPFLAASQTTLTVDYRALHSDLRSSWRQQIETPASRSSSACSGSASASRPPSQASSEASTGCAAEEGRQASDAQEQGDAPGYEAAADPDEEAEQECEYTVVHNGMIITHVPASEVSKVRSMVQYWEAVASGTPMVEAAAAAGVTAEEAAAAEAYATAAVAAAEAALAEQERAAAAAATTAGQRAAEQQPQAGQEQQQAAGQEWAVAMAEAVARELQEAEAAQQLQHAGGEPASPVPAAQVRGEAEPTPAATPSSFTARLPVGEATTPCSQPVAAAVDSGAGTPARFTPLNFVAAPPPTPSEGIDPQQAQQLHSLAVGMAAAAVVAGTGAGSGASTPAGTPVSALRTASRLPATPAGTPHSVSTPAGTPHSMATPAGTPASSRAAAAALAVTPLALSALRARMNGSGGGVQDAVRSRLARLKADLQAAQAKLATVDQGLASIAFTPTCSTSGTPGSRSSSILRGRTPATPSSGGPLGSPIAASGSPPFGGSSRAAALIAAGGASPLAPAGASPLAISQPARRGAPAVADPASPAAVAARAVQASAPAGAAAATAAPAECTPPVTWRSVHFAAAVPASSGGKGPLRVGTPYSSAGAAGAGGEEEEGGQAGDESAAAAAPSPAIQSASPVVASCPRGLPGWTAASPAAGAAAAGQRRSPLAPMQSAAKPTVGGALGRRFELQSDDGSSDEESELLLDASRMAQRANRAAQPSPLRACARTDDGATPMARPERSGWQAADAEEEAEGSGSVAAGLRARGRFAAGATTPATSVLSTSSFSPPQPLVLLAVRPLGRARRGGGAGLLRGGGRLRGEAEEREFRRRAAALNIQVSPYFRRGAGADRQ
ncbi:hypothetical protein ABPG75_013173 [Micractinium tetrahymenae]